MKILKRFVIVITLVVVLYFTFGIFVTQPIGAVPQGSLSSLGVYVSIFDLKRCS